MKIFLLLVLGVSFCGAQTDDISEADLLAEYGGFFALSLRTFEYEGEQHVNVSAEVADADSMSALAVLAERGSRYIEYLLLHASSLSEKKEEAVTRGEEALYQMLKEDTLFKQYFYPVAALALASQGIRQHFAGVVPRDVTPADVRQVASRFMFPKWREDGKMRMYNCIGINGWNGYEGERDLALEAFSYAAVIDNPGDDSLVSMFHREMFDYLGTLTKDGVQDQNTVRQKLWTWVASNSSFAEILCRKYLEMKNILPFTVRDWQ